MRDTFEFQIAVEILMPYARLDCADECHFAVGISCASLLIRKVMDS